MSVTLLPGNATVGYVQLSHLVSLDEAGFQDACFALREKDYEHIARLSNMPANELPPIETVRVDMGGTVRFAVVDGYHRRDAAIVREDETIPAISRTYADEEAVIDASFQANLKHGLIASKATRTEYALWLYFSDTKDTLSMRDIARKAGLNVSTVSRAIKKAEAATEDNEACEESTRRAEISSAQKLLNALRKFYREEHALLSKGNGKRDVLVANALYKTVAGMPKEKHGEVVQDITLLVDALEVFIDMVHASSRTNKKTR